MSTFEPIRGAQGYQQSNPSVLATASLLGSLQVFQKAGMMEPLRKRSLELTGALESLLSRLKFYVPLQDITDRGSSWETEYMGSQTHSLGFTIITPSKPQERGSMLSLLIFPPGKTEEIFDTLMSFGVIGDRRNPSVIRLAPAPLFNSLRDCHRAADALEKAFEMLA
jgi:kynureninase